MKHTNDTHTHTHRKTKRTNEGSGTRSRRQPHQRSQGLHTLHPRTFPKPTPPFPIPSRVLKRALISGLNHTGIAGYLNDREITSNVHYVHFNYSFKVKYYQNDYTLNRHLEFILNTNTYYMCKIHTHKCNKNVQLCFILKLTIYKISLDHYQIRNKINYYFTLL